MVRGIDRRTFLEMLGTAPLVRSGMAVAGAEHETVAVSSAEPTRAATDRPRATGVTWSSVQEDAARGGFLPDVSGEPRDGFEKVWSYGLDAQVNKGVVHRDGRVFVGTDERLVALDAADGTELWTKSFEAVTGVAATDTAVIANDTNLLYAFDPADGSRIWSAEVGAQAFLYHEAENLVFSTYGIAVDADDGSDRWETSVSPRSESELPAADDRRIYLTKTEDIHAVNATNGEKLWQTETGKTLVRPTVQPALDTVFAANMHAPEVYAFDTSDGGSLKWSVDLNVSAENLPSVAVTGNTVYVSLEYPGMVTALSVSDGSELWTYETESVDSPPVRAGDTVYVGGQAGDDDRAGLIALDTGDGSELAHFADPDTTQGVTFAEPVAVGGEQSGPTLFGGTYRLFAVTEGEGGGGEPGLALSLSDDTAPAGGVAEIDITVSNPGTATTTGVSLTVYVPSEEWTAAGELPSFDTVAAGGSDTQTLGLNVPDEASGEYDILGVATDDAGNRAEDEGTVTVEELSFELEMEGGATEPGGSVRVGATVENTGVTAEDVTLDLPEPLNGWDRTVDDTAGATQALYSGEDAAYVTGLTWQTFPAEEVETPSYVLDVPEDADPGTHTVEASVSVGAGDPLAEASATVEVSIDTVSLELPAESVRPVQVVENSGVEDVQHDPIPDPDMVAGRPTSVLFRLAADNVEYLSADREVPVRVEVDGPDAGPFELALTGEEVQSLAGLTGQELVWQFAQLDAEIPVFDMPTDLDAITVTVGPADGTDPDADVELDGASRTLTAGEDFAVQEGDTLFVGFIEVRDPADGSNYAGVFGDGEVGLYQEAHEAILDYLKQVYPTDPENVIGFSHYQPIEGSAQSGNITADLQDAHDALMRYGREFQGVEPDVTVALVPGQEYDDEGNLVHASDTYFDFHGKTGTSGVESTAVPNQPQTATAVEVSHTMEDGDVDVDWADVGMTAAQEIGHHFLPAWDPEDHSDDTTLDPLKDNSDRPLYPDPLAQRRDPSAGDPIDNSHARDELRSRGYDLVGGFGLPGGAPFPNASFMSYVNMSPSWADAYVYQELLEGGFEPTPPEASGPLETILSGIARVTDDGLEIENTTRREGRTPDSVEGGELAFDLTDPAGETIETQRVSTLQGHTHAGGDATDAPDGDRVVFTIPFPEATQTVQATDTETEVTTEFSPVDLTIVGALQRLPDAAFAESGDVRRETLVENARSVTAAVDAEDYESASEGLDRLESRVEEWVLSEYGAAANQPTKEDLRELLGDLRERVQRLETVAPDTPTPTRSPTPSPTVEPPPEESTGKRPSRTDARTGPETTGGDGALPTWLTGAAVTGAGVGVWLRETLRSDDD